MVYPSYRELTMALHRGLDPVSIFQIMRGISHATWDVDAHHFGLFSFVVGAQTLQATGYAMGVTLDGADEVVLVCLGDGATSEGMVNEAFNYAAVFNAPVVFLVQNNQYAISVPNGLQFRGAPAARAQGFGIPGIRVDGNDLLAVNAVVTEAAERARRGEGPTVIEAMTYRLGAHTTADDPTRYRSREEEQLWAGRDPLIRTERWLRDQGTDDAYFADLAAEGDALATDVRARVLALEPVGITDLYEHVLAEPSPALAEEREQVTAYLANLEGR
jgi:pyruvate dehydrogenase E1 component alpha subunit